MEIVHVTSVHCWRDTRILHKMCRSLADAGHRVHLVVPRADSAEVERWEGVYVHGIPLPRNRLQRVGRTAVDVLRRAADLPGALYHFHDPELLWYARGFQRRVGRPVVYDAHEDVRLQVYDKTWIPSWGRGMVSLAVGRLEDHVSRHLAGVVAATPSIA